MAGPVGPADRTFQADDRAMLWPTELLDAAEVGKLRPRRKGPFYDGGGRGPQHICTDLAAPKRSPAVSVDRLEPCHSRVARHFPGPLSGSGWVAGGGPASQPQDPPRRRRGRTYCLVRWQGRPPADDSWEPVELLAPFFSSPSSRSRSRSTR